MGNAKIPNNVRQLLVKVESIPAHHKLLLASYETELKLKAIGLRADNT